MSNDLISRQAAIDALCRGEGCKNVCRQALEHLPSVQPEIVRCEEYVYRRNCMLQHFVESNAVDGTKIDWSEWYCADGVWDINVPRKSDGKRKEGRVTKSEIILRMKSADGVYGLMYGGHGGDEEDYVFISKSNLHKWGKDTYTGYYFIWGWPGPDYNVYLFSDYGRTWSFDEDDLIKRGYKKYD